jgi:DNA-binding transcriptional regulator YdaS (Cro superfamily)
MSGTSTRPVVLDESTIRVYLMRYVEQVGGQQALARRLNVSQREISLAVNGKRRVSRRLAAALGYQQRVRPRQVFYEQIPRVPR